MDKRKFINTIDKFLLIIKNSKNLDSKVISVYYFLNFLIINKTLLIHDKQAKYIAYEVISDNYIDFEKHTFNTDLGDKYYNLFVDITNNIYLLLPNKELEDVFTKKLKKYLNYANSIYNKDNKLMYCYYLFLYLLNNNNNLSEIFKIHNNFYTTVKNKIYEIEESANNSELNLDNCIYKKYKNKLLYTLKLLKEKLYNN